MQKQGFDVLQVVSGLREVRRVCDQVNGCRFWDLVLYGQDTLPEVDVDVFIFVASGDLASHHTPTLEGPLIVQMGTR